MREHTVAVTIAVPDDIDHPTVQSIVVTGCLHAFAEIDRGPIEVRGVDLAKLQEEHARLIKERNELHTAWVDAVEKVKNTEAAIRQRRRHSNP